MNLPGLETCKNEVKLMDLLPGYRRSEIPGIVQCIDFNLMEVIMEKPAFASVESIVKKEDAIESAFSNLKKELSLAVKDHIAVIETKLKSALAENERLHHERLILAKEIQRRRSQEVSILEILGARDGSKG